jgi:hypothetical protein
MEQNTNTSLFDLHIDPQSSAYLGETAKWAKFLAILGFVLCGICVLVAIFAGSFLAGALSRYGQGGGMIGGAFFSVIYILLALLYFFPCLYLYNFASKMQVALRNNDQEQLAQSFRNLKSCYKFLGILMVIMLSFYALALIIGIFAASFR